MKKAQMSLQVIFVLFISIIVLVILISLLVSWTSKSKIFIKKLAKTDEQGSLVREDFSTKDEAAYKAKIIQMAEVCYEYGKIGKVDGTLCYTVRYDTLGICPNCQVQINNALTAKGVAFQPLGFLTQRTIISYDYTNKRVLLE